MTDISVTKSCYVDKKYMYPMNTLNRRKTTTITLTTAVYNDLKSITCKGETFDNCVSFLLRLYHHICKENETNRKEIEEILDDDGKDK